MIDHQVIRSKTVQGRGLLNSLINNLPIELHLPGYQYCGPGTKLQERLARRDPGINGLDKACKEHDIAYSKFKNISDRHIADRLLSEKAWQRVKSSDANLSERANAWLVTNVMKAKIKTGMGLKHQKSFQGVIRNVRAILKSRKPKNTKEAVKLAIAATKNVIGRKKSVKHPRVIKVPKVGGILPLLPIFAGLSALGALSGGAAGIAKAVNDASAAKKSLEEKSRHNRAMESIAIGGNGLYLKPYKKGFGLFLNPKNY